MKHLQQFIIGILLMCVGLGIWYMSLAEYQKRRLSLMMPIASIQRYHQLEEICKQAANDQDKTIIERRFIDALGTPDTGLRLDMSFDRTDKHIKLSTTSFWGYDTCVVPYQGNAVEAPYLTRTWRTTFF